MGPPQLTPSSARVRARVRVRVRVRARVRARDRVRVRMRVRVRVRVITLAARLLVGEALRLAQRHARLRPRPAVLALLHGRVELRALLDVG